MDSYQQTQLALEYEQKINSEFIKWKSLYNNDMNNMKLYSPLLVYLVPTTMLSIHIQEVQVVDFLAITREKMCQWEGILRVFCLVA